MTALITNMKIVFKILLLIIVVEAVILFKPGIKSTNPKTSSNLQKYAQDVLAKCSKEKYRPGCYDKEIPKLMDYISMEDAFRVTRIVQDEDKNYFFLLNPRFNTVDVTTRLTQKSMLIILL